MLCSLGQNYSTATTVGYVFRMSGLRDVLTKYGLSQGGKLVFRCFDHKATGIPQPSEGNAICTYFCQILLGHGDLIPKTSATLPLCLSCGARQLHLTDLGTGH